MSKFDELLLQLSNLTGQENDYSPLHLIERKEDMSPDGFLRCIIQNDGDGIIAIVPGKDDISNRWWKIT